MELPVLPFKIPELALPFDLPVLMHPPVDHIVIALPLVVLLLEIVNLFIKKRAIGVTSFFLLLLTVVAAIAAYYTGSVDGKEAFEALSQTAQSELNTHKQLGTYLMLASMIVLFFKLLSSMVRRGLMKALYLLILILFVAGILKQGKEGGELVYKYGVNVEKVSTMESEVFDLKEEIETLKEQAKPVVKKVEEKAVALKKRVTDAASDVAEKTSKVVETAKESVAETVASAKEKSSEIAATVTEKSAPEAVESSPALPETTVPAAEKVEAKTVEAEAAVSEAASTVAKEASVMTEDIKKDAETAKEEVAEIVAPQSSTPSVEENSSSH